MTTTVVDAARGSHPLRVRAWDSVSASPLAAASIGFLLLLVLVALLAPIISPADPLAQELANGRQPPFWWPGADSRGTGGVLGTDALGRDILSRLMYGSRVSLAVGFSVVGLALLMGVPLGLVAGYRGGLPDDIVMRIADGLLAVPTLLMAVVIIAVLGPNLLNLAIVLTVSRWVLFARVVRGDVLVLKEVEFTLAARAIGATTLRIMSRHLLPNVASPVIVLASLSVAQVVLAEASLSFLGLGVQPPYPTWGGMLSEGRAYVDLAPWLGIFPGIAITATVLAVNLVGDWLRDILDPRVQS